MFGSKGLLDCWAAECLGETSDCLMCRLLMSNLQGNQCIS